MIINPHHCIADVTRFKSFIVNYIMDTYTDRKQKNMGVRIWLGFLDYELIKELLPIVVARLQDTEVNLSGCYSTAAISISPVVAVPKREVIIEDTSWTIEDTGMC